MTVMWNYTLTISLISALALWLLVAASRTRRSVWISLAIVAVSGIVSSTIITAVGLQWFRGYLTLDNPIVGVLGYDVIVVHHFETLVLIVLFSICVLDAQVLLRLQNQDRRSIGVRAIVFSGSYALHYVYFSTWYGYQHIVWLTIVGTVLAGLAGTLTSVALTSLWKRVSASLPSYRALAGFLWEKPMGKKQRLDRILFIVGAILLAMALVGIVLRFTRSFPRAIRRLDVSRDDSASVELDSISSLTTTPTFDDLNNFTRGYSPTPQVGQFYNTAPVTVTNTVTTDTDASIPSQLGVVNAKEYTATPGATIIVTGLASSLIYTSSTEYNSILSIRPISVSVSDTVVITFAVTNNASEDCNSPITITAITDSLVGIPTLIDASDGDTQLASGESWLYIITHTISSRFSLITSTMTVTGVNHNNETLSASKTYFINLRLPIDSVLFVGETITYTVMIRNTGNMSATAMEIHMLIPHRLVFFSSLHYTPTEIIEVEWPKKMEVDRSDSVRISLIQTEDGEYISVLEIDDHVITATTPIPAGTPEVPLDQAFGFEYEGFARANLAGAAFVKEALASQEQSLDQKRITWEWSIITDKPGEQVLEAIIEVKWRPKDGGDPIMHQTWRQHFDILVQDPFIPTNVLTIFIWFSGIVGTVISILWAYDRARQWKAREQTLAPIPEPASPIHTAKESPMPIKILFLAANPTDTARLRLDQESRAIDQALRQAEFREFDVKQHWAVRVTDLQGYLLRHKPDIVHFSGHGGQSSEIILEDNAGNSHPVSVRALSTLFSVLKDNIRCVVLNACYSEQQAQVIAEHIDCVIGMSTAIGDAAAISFATAFYQALGYGRDVKTAFDLGCIQVDMENLDEQDTPKLLTTKGDPEQIVFVQSK